MKSKIFIIALFFSFFSLGILQGQKVFRIGIIGLDTSHSPAFIKMLNGEDKKAEYADFRIVAAYPYGSKTIENSYKRIPGYTEEAKKYGVEIVGSIAELLDKVDFVMLETNDGNLHLEQAYEVFKSGKPVFIDKPVAATLVETLAIFMLSEKYNVPMFSSSSLRYNLETQKIKNGAYGKVLGADCYSPAPGEPSHADFSWYGIHGVETLYTVMGTGCKEVSRVSSDGMDVVTGLWDGGRIGTFRGIRAGKQAYGGTAFCEKENVPVGGYPGYEVLLVEILKFFKTKVVPIAPEETIEIFAFMEASNESKRNNGKLISIQETLQKGEKAAAKILKKRKW
ncbi:Gfo/Idh/MocA family protein [Parabacteroides sp. Marseille-P3160]|uniref:Gfo/Idh/MocA family protein n=1 Tax=Parabacteroides sp. Marseille-P3160 TaxID=1917887 RepID=UPI0009BC58A1|nr:Gfo/Idh/MocA family oxidoreductase [Parabacteroides sp. Marseille-P3160]